MVSSSTVQEDASLSLSVSECLSGHSVNKRFKESSYSSGSFEKDVTDSSSLEKSSINSCLTRLLVSRMNL